MRRNTLYLKPDSQCKPLRKLFSWLSPCAILCKNTKFHFNTSHYGIAYLLVFIRFTSIKCISQFHMNVNFSCKLHNKASVYKLCSFLNSPRVSKTFAVSALRLAHTLKMYYKKHRETRRTSGTLLEDSLKLCTLELMENLQ